MKLIIRFFSIILLLLFIPIKSSWGQTHLDWSYNLSIYEVNTRQFTSDGTFDAFSTHLDRLQDMGVGILWFMPVHPIGEQNRLGSMGSFYSVKDYLDVSSDYGTLSDFKDLVDEIHARDMYVIIDWVPNHTSWDNVLTTEHPEWYTKDSDGNFVPPAGTNWTDVIDMDYEQQGLREYMIDALKFWVDSAGVDGFRFDAVDYLPDDFMAQMTDSLKKHKPDILLLAEGADEKYHDLGFDMNYAWDLYGFGGGILKNIADRTANASILASYAAGEKTAYESDELRMYFISNHDENSWHGTTFELFGTASDAFTILTNTIHGMPLVYNGEEANLNKRLEFFEKDLIPWGSYSKSILFERLFKLRKENPALWSGDPENYYSRILTSDNSNIFAYYRSKNEDAVLVLLNLSTSQKTFTMLGNAYFGSWKNIFTNDTTSYQETTEFTLPAWGYRVFESVETTGTYLENERITDFVLEQNYPNPFNPTTTIKYQVPSFSKVKLSVYDMLGRNVATLVDQNQNAGHYQINFNAEALPSGIYMYQLNFGEQSLTRKMMLVK